MTEGNCQLSALIAEADPVTTTPAPEVEIVIEIPRWSFLKWGSRGQIDFVSPLPCPYNYGAVPDLIGGEGDLLDALVIGRRLPRGKRLRLRAWGAIGMAERGLYDDKLICSAMPLTAAERRQVLEFFQLYAACKALLNRWRGYDQGTHCVGWQDAEVAIARCQPRSRYWSGPTVPF